MLNYPVYSYLGFMVVRNKEKHTEKLSRAFLLSDCPKSKK